MGTKSSWMEVGSPETNRATFATKPGKLPSPLLGRARFRLEQLVQIEQRTFLSLLFLAALLIRLIALFLLRHVGSLPGRQEGADGIEFEQLARALAEGRGYVRPNGVPTSFRAPGFPMFVSVIYRITHMNVSAATLTFPLLGAAVCVVTYLLAREVVSERAARVAALLSVAYFPAIYFSTVWLSEPLFMFSFGLSLWLFLVYLRNGSRGALVAAGLLFSWSVLVRPFAILMLPALLLIDFVYSRKRLVTVPVLLVCSLVPTLLWTARNYRVYHAFVLVATSGGAVFYGGNNDVVLHEPQHMGGWISSTHLPGRALIEAAPNEYLHDQVEWKLGKQWVRAHVSTLPLLVAMKLIRFVLPDFDSENKEYVILSVITYIPFIPLLLLGFRASALRENRTAPWLLIHFAIATTIATAAIFWGNPRFRDAAAPLLMLYAGAGLDRLIASRPMPLEVVPSRMAAD